MHRTHGILFVTVTGIILLELWLWDIWVGLLYAALVVNVIHIISGCIVVLKNRNICEWGKNDIRIRDIITPLAKKMQIPVPKICVIQSDLMQAEVTSIRKNNGIIVFYSKILELKDEELQGICAHELGHIKNYDVFSIVFFESFNRVVAMIKECLYGIFKKNFVEFTPQKELEEIYLSNAYLVLVRWLSRSMEFKTDNIAAITCNDATGLIRALEKMDNNNKNPQLIKGESKELENTRYLTHPSTEQRVEKLKEIQKYLS